MQRRSRPEGSPPADNPVAGSPRRSRPVSPRTQQESGGPARQPLESKPRLSGTLLVELELDEAMPVTQGELEALERLLDNALAAFMTPNIGTPDK